MRNSICHAERTCIAITTSTILLQFIAKPPGIKVEQLLMQKLGLLAVEEEEERGTNMPSSPKSILKQQAKKKFLDPRRPLLKTEFAAEIFGIYLTRGSRVSYEKKRMRSMRTGSSMSVHNSLSPAFVMQNPKSNRFLAALLA